MDLVGRIERSGRFIKDYDSRLLADGSGNEDPLAFPGAQLIELAPC